MDFRTRLKVATGKRRAKRGNLHPPPIGTWERHGWDEWHNDLDWHRRQREVRENKDFILTGHFKPVRARTRRRWLSLRIINAPMLKIFAALAMCGTLFLAGQYAFDWL